MIKEKIRISDAEKVTMIQRLLASVDLEPIDVFE